MITSRIRRRTAHHFGRTGRWGWGASSSAQRVQASCGFSPRNDARRHPPLRIKTATPIAAVAPRQLRTSSCPRCTANSDRGPTNPAALNNRTTLGIIRRSDRTTDTVIFLVGAMKAPPNTYPNMPTSEAKVCSTGMVSPDEVRVKPPRKSVPRAVQFKGDLIRTSKTRAPGNTESQRRTGTTPLVDLDSISQP
jgi:hypothetical protein